MTDQNLPIFVNLAQAERDALELQKAEKAARMYERTLNSLFETLTVIFGDEAAQQIKVSGYTAVIDGAYVWRFDRFGFKPYNYTCTTDDVNKWFNFAVMASNDPTEQSILIGFNAVDSMSDVIEKINYADRHYASKKKVKTIEPEVKDTPVSKYLVNLSGRIKTGLTTTYQEDIIIALAGWITSQDYDDDVDEYGDDE